MNPDFVVDASVLLEVLGAVNPDRGLMARVLTGTAAAPEVIDLEVINTISRFVRRRLMTQQTADGIVENLAILPLMRSPHRPLISRVWELRHSITAYDASYVALAEELDIPLLTCDAKLAGANSYRAAIELYPNS